MKAQRLVMLGSTTLIVGLLGTALHAEPKEKVNVMQANQAEPETKASKRKKGIEGPEALRFTLTSESVAKIYDKVFDADFLPRYRKSEPGPAMNALDQELADRKSELRRVVEFGDTPSALENTPLKGEFTYNNDESLNHTVLTRTMMNDDLQAERSVGYHRYFFYFGDKLWKIYDEYKLGKKGLYDTFQQGVERMSTKLGSKPKLLQPDAAALRDYATAQWIVGEMVVQLLDRHEEGRVAVVYIQKSVLDNLAKYRSNKPETEGMSNEVMDATSKPSSSKPKSDSSPADAYTRKRKQSE